MGFYLDVQNIQTEIIFLQKYKKGISSLPHKDLV